MAVAAIFLVIACSPTQEPSDPSQKEDDASDQEEEPWEAPEVDEETRKPLLLVGIDGVKPSYFERYESALSNLNELADQGVRAESLKPVMPSHTFPNLYSIATGMYPENHGIVANRVYDEERDATLTMRDDDEIANPSWWGGEPIWVSAEKQGLTTATFFWVGSEAPIKGIQPTHWVPYDSVPHQERTDQVLEWLTGDDPVDFATLYFAAPDGAGHQHGPHSQDVGTTLRQVDRQIGRLIDGLHEGGVWPDINIIFVSDHGMTDLDEDRVIFLDDIIDLGDVHVIDWSPMAAIAPREGKTDSVYQALAEAEDDHAYSVYRREDIPERFRLRESDRIPEIVVIADKPYALTSRSYFDSQGLLSGGHGFDPQYEAMHGFFVAYGPDFPREHPTGTLQVVDIYALMSHLLALDPAEHDGSLERIGIEIYGE